MFLVLVLLIEFGIVLYLYDIPKLFENDTFFTEFTFKAFDVIAENTSEYCKKGDIIGVKGRLQSSSFDKEDGSKEFRIEPIAEKVTFLSSRSKDTPERE